MSPIGIERVLQVWCNEEYYETVEAVAQNAALRRSHMGDSSEELLCDIIIHGREIIGSDGLPIISIHERVQYVVQFIRDFYHSDVSASYLPLSRVRVVFSEGAEVHLISKIAQLVLKSRVKAVAYRAAYSLKLMEDIDPRLSIISKAVDRYLRVRSKESELGIKRAIDVLINSGLYFDYPIKAIQSPRAPGIAFVHPIWNIKEVIFRSELEFPTNLILRNVQEIARQEGFTCSSLNIENQSFRWLCDPLFVDFKGIVWRPEQPLYPLGIKRFIHDMYMGSSCHFFQDMGNVAEQGALNHLCDKTNIPSLEFYVEGGNFLKAVNRNGEPLILCGAANLLRSAVDKFCRLSLSELDSLKEKLEKQEESDLLKFQKIVEGLLVSQFYEYDSDDFCFPLQEKEIQQLVRCLSLISEEIKKTMKRRLNVPVLVLGRVFEPQPAFHLDMFLAPAPGGRVFLHCFNKAISLLETLLQNKNLKSKIRDRLMQYLKTSKMYQENYQTQIDDIAEQLQGHEIDVIRVSGLFYNERGSISINYLNSIFGQSERGVYCITNGSVNAADEWIRQEFISQVHQEGVDRLYFVGRTTRGPLLSKGHSYCGAQESLWKSGGVHCLFQVMHNQQAALALKLELGRSDLEESESELEESDKYDFYEKIQSNLHYLMGNRISLSADSSFSSDVELTS